METTAAPIAPPRTVAEFEQWQRAYGDEGQYEFVRGQIIPKPAMKQNEVFVALFLNRLFLTTQAHANGDALLAELDAYVDEDRKRIPHLSYYPIELLRQMQQDVRVAPPFAIEILSDSEKENDIIEKIQDYFDAGVRLVWYIVPKFQKIYAYTSPDDIRVFRGEQVISAAPVLPDFQFAVADLFRE